MADLLVELPLEEDQIDAHFDFDRRAEVERLRRFGERLGVAAPPSSSMPSAEMPAEPLSSASAMICCGSHVTAACANTESVQPHLRDGEIVVGAEHQRAADLEVADALLRSRVGGSEIVRPVDHQPGVALQELEHLGVHSPLLRRLLADVHVPDIGRWLIRPRERSVDAAADFEQRAHLERDRRDSPGTASPACRARAALRTCPLSSGPCSRASSR